MIKRRLNQTVLTLILCFTLFITTGCWDSTEIESLAIVTGIGLDKGKEKELKLNVQIGNMSKNTSSKEGQSGGGGDSGESNHTLLSIEKNSILEAIEGLRMMTSRSIFLHHNQMIVLSEELCEGGIEQYFDMFIRNTDTRLEVLMFVTRGETSEVLNAAPPAETICAMALTRMVALNQNIYPEFGVNLLTLTSNFMGTTNGTAIPIVKVEKKENGDYLSFDGFAVFQRDVMVGSFNKEEGIQYSYLRNSVKKGSLEFDMKDGRVTVYVNSEKPKIKVEKTKDNKIRVKAELTGTFTIGELQGFKDVSIVELFPKIEQEANKHLKEDIEEIFKRSQELNADVFEIGKRLEKSNWKDFRELKPIWYEVYPTIEFESEVKLDLISTGQITDSMEMRGGSS